MDFACVSSLCSGGLKMEGMVSDLVLVRVEKTDVGRNIRHLVTDEAGEMGTSDVPARTG